MAVPSVSSIIRSVSRLRAGSDITRRAAGSIQRADDAIANANKVIAARAATNLPATTAATKPAAQVAGRIARAAPVIGGALTAYTAYNDYQSGSAGGDPARGSARAAGSLIGGTLGAAVPIPGLNVLTSIAGSAVGGALGEGIYDRVNPEAAIANAPTPQGMTPEEQRKYRAARGISPNSQSPTTNSQSPTPRTDGYRFGADDPELAGLEMLQRTAQRGQDNQRISDQGAQYNQRYGAGLQLAGLKDTNRTQNAIAQGAYNRDIVTTRDIQQGETARTGIVVGGNVRMTELNTGRDIRVAGIGAERDIRVAGIGAERDVKVVGLQEGGQTTRAAIAADVQKYTQGSGNLKTEAALKGLQDTNAMHRYTQGSGDRKTDAQVTIARINKGLGGEGLGMNYNSPVLQQQQAQQAMLSRASFDRQVLQEQSMQSQRKRDNDQMALQQFGLMASLYR